MVVDTAIGVGAIVVGGGTGIAWATCGLATGGIGVGAIVVGVDTGMAWATCGLTVGATAGVLENRLAIRSNMFCIGGCGTCELLAGVTGLASAVPVKLAV